MQGWPPTPFAALGGLLIDLDGVVYVGRSAIPGAAEFLAEARRRGLPFLLVTNNSTTSPAQVAERLRGMRILVDPAEILTSAEVAAAHVHAHRQQGRRVQVVGEAGLRQAVEAQGLELAEDSGVDWVLVGLDRAFDYRKLAAATQAILGGARFVATNADALLPVEGGGRMPGAGAIVAAIHTATQVAPVVVGKPEPALFRHGLARLGQLPATAVAMVGDRLDTDVEGGRRAGLRTVLVLSGVTAPAQLAGAAARPDAVVPDLAAVAGLLGWHAAC